MILILILTIGSQKIRAESNEYFTFELGAVETFSVTEVAQIGYMRKKGDIYLHFFWGSLEEELHDERTSYLFGELGYGRFFRETPYYWNVSLGIGKVSQTGKYLSTENMFTESIVAGYKNYYLSLRHFSNGGTILGNRGRNLGRNLVTLGVRF